MILVQRYEKVEIYELGVWSFSYLCGIKKVQKDEYTIGNMVFALRDVAFSAAWFHVGRADA
jgi:hypothetical protein